MTVLRGYSDVLRLKFFKDNTIVASKWNDLDYSLRYEPDLPKVVKC